uniref:Variant surface glycoprotein 1125.326 n=1 Tax=Trypanosoma brucei TaxID=5691 RepID=A0A1J0R5M4_9TRYP|nr:variant surface glycoprotein 1125.326 [Trypanosoma brucei]
MTLTKFETYALAALAVLTSATAADEAKGADVKTACDVHKYLTAMDKHLASLERSLRDTPQDLKQRARMYSLAAEAAPDAQAACLLQAVAADAASEAVTLETEYDDSKAAVAKGRSLLTTLLQQAAAAAALEKVSYKLTEPAGKSISRTSLAIRLDVGDISTAKCTAEEEGGGYKVNNKPLNALKIAKIKTADPAKHKTALARPAIKLTTASCTADDTATWRQYSTAAAACSIADATAAAPAAHTDDAASSAKATIKEVSIYTDDNPEAGCKTAEQITEITDSGVQQSFNHLCRALKTTKPSLKATTLEGKALSQKPIVQQVAQGCLPEYMNKDKLSPEETESLRKFLEVAYTDSGSNFAKKFEHLVEKQKVQVYRGGKVQSVDIASITTPAEEHDALSRISAKKRAEKLASRKETATPDQKESGDKTEEKKDGDNKGAAVNCSSHSTPDACTKGQNFKWENNKCKDSSFPVNNKLTLSMGAAFVSFIVF